MSLPLEGVRVVSLAPLVRVESPEGPAVAVRQPLIVDCAAPAASAGLFAHGAAHEPAGARAVGKEEDHR